MVPWRDEVDQSGIPPYQPDRNANPKSAKTVPNTTTVTPANKSDSRRRPGRPEASSSPMDDPTASAINPKPMMLLSTHSKDA